MKIYHYTNIEALALILKNKTIRFSRLDKVDDVEEGDVESLGVKFCRYVFVSCWTETSEENIPLWKMYGGDSGGVRITANHEMFKEYYVSNLKFGNQHSQGAIWSKIPHQDLINPDFFIMPIFDYNNDMFYRRVKYVDDVSQYTKNAIQVTNIKDNRGDWKMEMKPFGSYKNTRWKFQEETRFVLYALPINPLIEGANPELTTLLTQSLSANKTLSFSYYDMHLKDETLEDMEITLNPTATDSQRIIVQALVDKYAPNIKINDSALGELVRLK